MSVEIRSLDGPLSDEQVEWIVGLYGPVDAKYRSTDYVRHQFVENPFRRSVNVFAVDGSNAVGHCGVIPFAARRGTDTFVAGKLEALAVDSEYRGRREDGGSVATDILTRLYPFAAEQGMKPVFGLAPPAVARIHVRAGCHLVPTNAPAYTAVTDASSFAGLGANPRRRAGSIALAAVQRSVLSPFKTAFSLVPPEDGDAELASVPSNPQRWTVSGTDAWDWFVGSGVLRVLELEDARALIRLDDSQASTVQIISWRPRRAVLMSALRLLAAAAAVARTHRAPTLRFQPWRRDKTETVLARACGLAGFVRRPEADLLLFPEGPRVDEVQLTPFFYATF